MAEPGGGFAGEAVVDRRLHNCHVVVAVPGGTAAERSVGALPGTSHLVEHLLYRQNELAGHPLDRLGGRVGLQTTPEWMLVELEFRPEVIETALALVLEWWCAPRLTAEVLRREIAIVIDENRLASVAPARRLWARHLDRLGVTGHLRDDLGGDEDDLRGITVADALSVWGRLAGMGGAVASVGPVAPDLPGGTPAWSPPPIGLADVPLRRRLPPSAPGDAVVEAVRWCAGGLGGDDWLGAVAGTSVLRHSRVTPAHRRFHDDLELRRLEFELRSFSSGSFLVATGHVPGHRAPGAVPLVERALAECWHQPIDLLRATALHHLGSQCDAPARLARDEAVSLLLGRRSPSQCLERLQAMDASELAAAAARHATTDRTTTAVAVRASRSG